MGATNINLCISLAFLRSNLYIVFKLMVKGMPKRNGKELRALWISDDTMQQLRSHRGLVESIGQEKITLGQLGSQLILDGIEKSKLAGVIKAITKLSSAA